MSTIFAMDESSRLIHITEAMRGLACNCRCVGCNQPVIARQGLVRDHHFAHVSNSEACPSDYESLLHKYAKRCIVEANGLLVPMHQSVAQVLGMKFEGLLDILMACQSVDEEVTIGNIRPDLLVVTSSGIGAAIEIAYSSFCDEEKIRQFEVISLPVLEIDLSSFTPESFDPKAVRTAVIETLDKKEWLWPKNDGVATMGPVPPKPPFADEEILQLSGRRISIKRLPSGDITFKSIRFDADVVSLIKSVAKANHGKYQSAYKSWLIPRWRAPIAREHLRTVVNEMIIGVIKRSMDSDSDQGQ